MKGFNAAVLVQCNFRREQLLCHLIKSVEEKHTDTHTVEKSDGVRRGQAPASCPSFPTSLNWPQAECAQVPVLPVHQTYCSLRTHTESWTLNFRIHFIWILSFIFNRVFRTCSERVQSSEATAKMWLNSFFKLKNALRGHSENEPTVYIFC